MNKRISQLVAIGFAILISLGLATNVFLTWAVQQTLEEAHHIEETAVEARAATRSLRADYLEMGNVVSMALLDSALQPRSSEFQSQKEKIDGIANAHLQKASKNTRNEDLKRLLSQLKVHNDQVTEPLEWQLYKLAKVDPIKSRDFYITKYRPALWKNIELSEACLSLATQDVLDLKEDLESRSVQAQMVARMAILLFVVLGLGGGWFLTRAVSTIARQFEQTAQANRNMLEYSRDVICSIDERGCFIDVSPSCQKVWGYSPSELRGRLFYELLHPEDLAKTTEIAHSIMSGIAVSDFENRYLCKDKTVVDMVWSARWSEVEESMFCVAHDMTVQKQVQEKLRTLAMYDGLTGLLNRTAIMDRLTSEMERGAREGQTLSIVLIDLDHFKQVNDIHGHAAGDIVLKEAALRMKNSMRGYDTVGRYGGEEFLIVAPGCGEQDCITLAERVRDSISKAPIQIDQSVLSMTCSLGAAIADTKPRERPDELVERADMALYRAKANGRNRVELAAIEV